MHSCSCLCDSFFQSVLLRTPVRLEFYCTKGKSTGLDIEKCSLILLINKISNKQLRNVPI